MRHLIILSGNSLKNKAWGEAVLKHYGPRFDSIYLELYDHWESGEANINFENEEAKISQHVATIPLGTEITIMAKSAGSLLALLAISHGTVMPARCVFFGIPLDLAAGNLFDSNWSVLKSFKIPATAFHNIADPTTSYDFTKTTLANLAPHINLITTHEPDHWYADFTTYDKNLHFLTEKSK